MNHATQSRSFPSGVALLSGAAIGVVALVLAVAATTEPLALAALVVLITGAVLIGRSVDWATYAALFVVYSNAAVVAVNFHGVPPLAAHAVVGLLLIPGLFYGVLQNRGFVIGPAFPWLLGLGVVQLVGALWSSRPELAWEDVQTFLQEAILLYLLVVNAIRTESSLRGATRALLIAGCLMGGVPLLQQVRGDFLNQYGGFAQTGDEPGFSTGEVTAAGEVVQHRLAGPIGEKNRYAQIMLMLIPLGLLRLRDEQSRAWKLLTLIALGCATAGAFLAFSRSAIVAAGMVVLFAAWKRYVSRTKVMVAFAVAVLALLATPEYSTRMASLLNLKEMLTAGRHSEADGALKGRATEMGAAALVFVDHPLVGVGPGMFKYYSRDYGERIGLRSLAPERQAHCLPLDVAAENGLLGLICLFGVLGAVGIRLMRIIDREGASSPASGLPLAYLLMVAVYFASGLFLHFAFIRYFWLMIALADATVLVCEQREAGCRIPDRSFT